MNWTFILACLVKISILLSVSCKRPSQDATIKDIVQKKLYAYEGHFEIPLKAEEAATITGNLYTNAFNMKVNFLIYLYNSTERGFLFEYGTDIPLGKVTNEDKESFMDQITLVRVKRHTFAESASAFDYFNVATDPILDFAALPKSTTPFTEYSTMFYIVDPQTGDQIVFIFAGQWFHVINERYRDTVSKVKERFGLLDENEIPKEKFTVKKTEHKPYQAFTYDPQKVTVERLAVLVTEYSENVGKSLELPQIQETGKVGWAYSRDIRAAEVHAAAETGDLDIMCAKVKEQYVDTVFYGSETPQYGNCGEGKWVFVCLAYHAGLSNENIKSCVSQHDHTFAMIKLEGKAGWCIMDRWAITDPPYFVCNAELNEETATIEVGGVPSGNSYYQHVMCKDLNQPLFYYVSPEEYEKKYPVAAQLLN